MLEIDLEMEIGVRALGLRDFGGYLVNCKPRGSSGRAAGDSVGGGGRGGTYIQHVNARQWRRAKAEAAKPEPVGGGCGWGFAC